MDVFRGTSRTFTEWSRKYRDNVQCKGRITLDGNQQEVDCMDKAKYDAL